LATSGVIAGRLERRAITLVHKLVECDVMPPQQLDRAADVPRGRAQIGDGEVRRA
jgi:hypothetical protein